MRVCLPFHVEPVGDCAGTQKSTCRNVEFCGFNATMRLINRRRRRSSMRSMGGAARYESVNTVKITDGKLIGYNTDVRGLFQSFSDRGVDLKEEARIAVIIGAGGVAGAVSMQGAAEHGVERITASSTERRLGRKNSARVWNMRFAVAQTPENMKDAAKDADVIINCTSLECTAQMRILPIYRF